MGDASWFLGQRYNWHTDPNGKVSCHTSQQIFIEQMLEWFKSEDCKTARTPYRSGLKIEYVKHNNKPKSEKNVYSGISINSWLFKSVKHEYLTGY